MIYTITISPAIDYVVHLDEFRSGMTNRSSGEEYFLGGKGINVSQILKELGMKSVALGFTNGFTGQALENGLHDRGIETDFIYPRQGITRINVKIKAGEETEINGQGTIAAEAGKRRCADRLGQYPVGYPAGYIQQTSRNGKRQRHKDHSRYERGGAHGCAEIPSVPDKA